MRGSQGFYAERSLGGLLNFTMKVLKRAQPANGTGPQRRGRLPFQQECLRTALAGLTLLPLTGCLGIHTHAVDKTVLAENVQTAALGELLQKMQQEYSAVQTLSLSVNITAVEGGSRKGQVTELSSSGYIRLRKPGDLRVIILVPFVRSRALDMVSDGKDFKLLLTVPTRPSRAIVGSDQMAPVPSKNGLENLRPFIIRDALQIPPVSSEDYVTQTEDSRILPPAHPHREAIEEPDYDITVLDRRPDAAGVHVLGRQRVIHISRVTLLPYEQDLYDEHGRVVTTITYSKYQKFGDLDYPMSIFLKRPLDEYTLQIDITKLTLNQPLDDEDFKLTIPDGIPIQHM